MKVITAMGDPYINEQLKGIECVEVIGKDIQYQEGVIEILELQNNIDIVVLSDSLPEEYGFNLLINKIRSINENIEIIVFLKEKNTEREIFLNSKKIYKIYYIHDYNYSDFLNNFSNQNTDFSKKISAEIEELKGLILDNNYFNSNANKVLNNKEKSKNKINLSINKKFNGALKSKKEKSYMQDNNNSEEKINYFFENNDNKNNELNKEKTVINKFEKYEEIACCKENKIPIFYKNNYENSEKNIKKITQKYEENDREKEDNNEGDNNFYFEERKDKKVIAIAGSFGTGKSVFSSLLANCIASQGKKTLLIDFDIFNLSINTILGINKYPKNHERENISALISSHNANLDVLCATDSIISKLDKSEFYKIKEILKNLKQEYDFIIIDTSSDMKFEYVKTVLSYGDKIIFLVEPNISEIKKANNLLEYYINDWSIDIDKIKIVFNKTNQYEIAKSILEEIFSEFEIIGNIKYDERYNLFINKNLDNKQFKEEYGKIYKKIRM